MLSDQPPEKAIKLLKKLGIDTSGDFETMMTDARMRGFVITKVVQADILESMKAELERALEEDIPVKMIRL